MRRILHILQWRLPKPFAVFFGVVGGIAMLYWTMFFAIHGCTQAAVIFGLLALVCLLQLQKTAR